MAASRLAATVLRHADRSRAATRRVLSKMRQRSLPGSDAATGARSGERSLAEDSGDLACCAVRNQ
jgi:hypothetical protein